MQTPLLQLSGNQLSGNQPSPIGLIKIIGERMLPFQAKRYRSTSILIGKKTQPNCSGPVPLHQCLACW